MFNKCFKVIASCISQILTLIPLNSPGASYQCPSPQRADTVIDTAEVRYCQLHCAVKLQRSFSRRISGLHQAAQRKHFFYQTSDKSSIRSTIINNRHYWCRYLWIASQSVKNCGNLECKHGRGTLKGVQASRQPTPERRSTPIYFLVNGFSLI